MYPTTLEQDLAPADWVQPFNLCFIGSRKHLPGCHHFPFPDEPFWRSLEIHSSSFRQCQTAAVCPDVDPRGGKGDGILLMNSTDAGCRLIRSTFDWLKNPKFIEPGSIKSVQSFTFWLSYFMQFKSNHVIIKGYFGVTFFVPMLIYVNL